MADGPGVVERYVRLGLALGRHLDGLVDAYYGPEAWRAEAEQGPPVPLPALVADGARLVADVDGGADPEVEGRRRAWLRAQAVGLHTVARGLGGEDVPYLDEVELSYGVRPAPVPEDALAAAHRRLDAVLPGSGDVRERMVAWREAHVVPAERLEGLVRDLADDLRERTDRAFGLPEGEEVEWVLETDKPWSGFNYYLGGLRSRVAINIDLPVPSLSLPHLVAHEAYPGHHTEHCRKEVGLVRGRDQVEEAIFLVGTPQCLLAEGLADLALESLVGTDHEAVVAPHLASAGVCFDAEVAAQVREALSTVGAARGNVALMLHADGRPPEEAVAWAERWLLLPTPRAEKQVRFISDPTWRAYIFCYTEGVELCRRFAAGDPARFERLLSEQLLPADLVAPAA
ncbi:hypothetical protein PO878_07045 [Iamia majanohamensis]|uniref:DUF885 domain-containing protein n=1 Tax=Iamia majanohamensis TaxID=467976 RepID=A0AAF0BWU1_9ACTN|nr:hypothetical protein [Iamia majanohamensis]WCO68483.1 hypothetical protein PO878_07045 [Iamia majanohamensis]